MLSVRDSKELQAVILAIKAANRELRSDISKATRQVLGPIWVQELARNVADPMDTRVLLKGAKVKAGNPAIAQAGTSTKRLSGGLQPSTQWAAFEFGAVHGIKTTYERKGHKVTRRTREQLPRRRKAGRVVYPAFAAVAPRMISLWVQIVIKKYRDAAEGK